MKSTDEVTAVLTLHEKGIPKKRIARLTGIDPKTVRKIIRCGALPRKQRHDKIVIEEELLRRLYTECNGYKQRVHERLSEEYGVSAGYTTINRQLAEYGIGVKQPQNSARLPDMPGAEMQHDTSVHRIIIAGKDHRLNCSGLYLRYSKMRYIKYYRHFNRFTMKCFMDEALRYWGYSAEKCIIDNTSLAVHYGSGSKAVFSDEMINFASRYGFIWQAHEINHPNRKAGVERVFRTVETNFLPGRTFTSLDDLNRQALEWATQRYAQRPQAKSGVIPLQLFEHEKSSLRKQPEFIHQPYLTHQRIVDQYGFIAFKGNFYWTSSMRGKTVTVVEYAQKITIFEKTRQEGISYELPDELATGQIIRPEHITDKHPAASQPNNYKHDYRNEEQLLRKIDETVATYIDFVLSAESGIVHRCRFIRDLHRLMGKTTTALFIKAVHRAYAYKVNSITQLTGIFTEILREPLYEKPSTVDRSEIEKRDSYQNGRFTQENDISSTEEP